MMLLSLAVAILLVGEPAAATVCPAPREVRVLHREARWWLDEAGIRTVADVAAYVRTHPPAKVWLDSDYYAAGNTAVSIVHEAFKVQGMHADYVWVTSGPRGGPEPTPPAGYMEVSIQIDCDG